ncbi:hypothetical protein QJS04_geneDACA000958 [Acorus gramineus]|uniref:Uncharacterized protein n=1 Tax=Acorus gramineus TaxID=55184 RepID=A0AAV9AEN1_ACOGR|nr:hypothetical protein QJS04_geneDACA000958 [Acorus gramineus]
MDSSAYFETDEDLRRQIMLLLVEEEEGLKDTTPTRAASGQLRLPIEVQLQRESNGTGVFIPRRSINPNRGSKYGGVHDQGSLCKHVVKS